MSCLASGSWSNGPTCTGVYTSVCNSLAQNVSSTVYYVQYCDYIQRLIITLPLLCGIYNIYMAKQIMIISMYITFNVL